MAFIQAFAPVGARTDGLLSADNGFPARHIVMDTLRRAAPLMGLKAPVLATLDAMLSCLPPQRSHHTVFASNRTLSFRLNGLTDRTIRRHVALLQEAGLLRRKDSPNGKRFTRRNASAGLALRFGFDLAPLYERLREIAGLAAEADARSEELAHLRGLIQLRLAERLAEDPTDPLQDDMRRALRRRLTLSDCRQMLAELGPLRVTVEETADNDDVSAREMSGSDSQNVRHHHKSNKEPNDKTPQVVTTLCLPDLLDACPDAAQFAMKPIQSLDDAVHHARMLAPMIGVDDRAYGQAQARIGPIGVTMTIWALTQMHERIQSTGAYFRAVTIGKRAGDFDPVRLIRRLARGGALSAG